jgi:hypothetical protein
MSLSKRISYAILVGVLFTAGVGFLLLNGCTREIVLSGPLPTPVDHDTYVHYLERAGLHETGLGRDWLAAAERALEEPIDIELPYRERIYFDPAKASSGVKTSL